MNVVVCHSHQQRCGVREYGLQLDRSLIALGVSVRPCTYNDLRQATEEMSAGDILLVHYEPNLVAGDFTRMAESLCAARDKGAKIIFCCHWYDHGHLSWYEQHGWVDTFVVHREYASMSGRAAIIPLGCPVYEPKRTRSQIRQQLEIPEDAVVIAMIGFLVRWKLIPEIVEASLNAMMLHPKLHLYVHAPWPFNTWEASVETPRIQDIIGRHVAGGQAHFSTEFVPEEATLDIAYAADLGLVFHPMNTSSVSAATKQFVSARRPLVVTNSSHAADIHGGVHRVDTFDAGAVARAAVAVATSPERLAALQVEAEHEYERLNMDAVAKRYVELFERLTGA